MNKVGRNDPCPCGSGKKHKQCCLLKTGGSGVKRKITAKWLNAKVEESALSKSEGVDLMERAFGQMKNSGKSEFHPIDSKRVSEGEIHKLEKKNHESE